MNDQFTDADHERALRAGRHVMGKTTPRPARKPSAGPLWAAQILWIAMWQVTDHFWHAHTLLVILGWIAVAAVILVTGGRYQAARDRWNAQAGQRPV